MRKVLHLIGSFHQGGSERQAIALARMMKDDGSFDVVMAVLNGEGVLLAEAEAIAGGPVAEFPLNSFYDANFFRQVSRFARFLSENEIDVVHTHDFYTNVFGMTAATLGRVPIKIASKRETAGVRTPTQELVERIAFTRANAVLANSHAVRERLARSGLSSDRIKVVYNGVDLKRFDVTNDARERVCNEFDLPPGDETQLVTMVANLRHPVKNVPMLLRVAQRVTQGTLNTHFILAGEGELDGDLRRQAGDLGISGNIHFIGRVDDVPTLLAASNACVLTSFAEGFSNSIIEYMAAARPVVATNAGGATEAVVNGETGFIVASDDDAEMAEKLTWLLKEPIHAKQMGERARQVAEDRFSSAAQLSAVLALYEEHLREGETYSDRELVVTPRYLENEASHS